MTPAQRENLRNHILRNIGDPAALATLVVQALEFPAAVKTQLKTSVIARRDYLAAARAALPAQLTAQDTAMAAEQTADTTLSAVSEIN